MRVVFHLKRPSISKRQAVFALYCFGPNQVKIYTGVSIKPNEWNSNRQRVKRSVKNSALLNDVLDQVEADIISIERTLRVGHQQMTVQRIKEEYRKLDQSRIKKQANTFEESWERWIEESKTSKRKANVDRYRTVLKHLRQFADAKHFELAFPLMGREFIGDLYEYLIHEVKLTNPSAWNVFKVWKTFMLWALENDLTDNRYFEKVRARNYNIQSNPIVRLSEAELQRIMNVDLKGDSRLENVRDTFILACCIGVRYGDLQQILANPSDYIVGDNIRLITEKNRKAVTIPILPVVNTILRKSTPLKAISNQKFNAYIKEIATLAGLTETVICPEYRGSQRLDKKLRKCDVISAHTAKRTFISLMIARNVSVDALIRITGNSRRTIDRYVQLNDEDIHNEMRKAADLLQ